MSISIGAEQTASLLNSVIGTTVRTFYFDGGAIIGGTGSYFGFPTEARFSVVNDDATIALPSTRIKQGGDLNSDFSSPQYLIGAAAVEGGGYRIPTFESGTSPRVLERSFTANGTGLDEVVLIDSSSEDFAILNAINPGELRTYSTGVTLADGRTGLILSETPAGATHDVIALYAIGPDGIDVTRLPTTALGTTNYEAKLLADGRVVIAYQSDAGAVMVQIVSEDLTTSSGEILVAAEDRTFFPTTSLDVAVLSDGRIAVSFDHRSAIDAPSDVKVALLNNDGSIDLPATPLALGTVADPFLRYSKLYPLQDGGFILGWAWNNGSEGSLQQFDSALTPTGTTASLPGGVRDSGENSLLFPNGSGFFDITSGKAHMTTTDSAGAPVGEFTYASASGLGGNGGTGVQLPGLTHAPVGPAIPVGEDFDAGRLFGNAGVGVDHQIATLSDGTVLLVWAGAITSGGGPAYEGKITDSFGGIFGQLLAADGRVISREFQINTQINGLQTDPQIAVTENGFTVMWTDTNGPDNLVMRAFRTDGAPETGEILLTPNTHASLGNDIEHAAITALPDGTFVVMYGADLAGQPTYLMKLAADGTRLVEPVLMPGNIDDANNTNLAVTTAGDVVAVNEGVSLKVTVRLSGAGLIEAAIGAGGTGPLVFTIAGAAGETQTDATVAALSDGGFVVGYHETVSNGGVNPPRQLWAEVFNGAGVSQGRVAMGAPESSTFAEVPALIGLSDGGFAMAYAADDASGTGVYAAAWHSNLGPRMALVRGNPIEVGIQDFPHLAEVAPGQVMLTYGMPNGTIYSATAPVSGVVLDLANPNPRSSEFGTGLVRGSDATDSHQLRPEDRIIVGGEGGDSFAGIAGQWALDGGAGSDALSLPFLDFNDAQITLRGDDRMLIRSAVDSSTVIDVTSVEIFFFEGGTFKTLADLQGTGGTGGTGGGTGGPVPISGTAAGETLLGTIGDDSILDLGGNDTVNGLGGIDTIDGGDGTDALQLQVGLAQTIVTDLGDGAFRLQSNDSVFFALEFDYTVTNVETFIFVPVDPISAADLSYYAANGNFPPILGTAGDERLVGNDRDNRIEGLAGHDRLEGRGGNDTLIGGPGDDTLWGFFGNDSLVGGDGFDIADYDASPNGIVVNLATGVAQDGTGGTDTLESIEGVMGGFGDDSITGDAGDNRFFFDRGDDTFDGADGTDSLVFRGLPLTDFEVFGSAAEGFTFFFDQLDPITGTVRNIETFLFYDATQGGWQTWGLQELEDYIAGQNPPTEGDDTVSGNGGNDVLDGLGGNDFIRGFSGDDTLIGSAGNDTIDGGNGYDIAQFSVNAADATIQFGGFGRATITSADGVDEVLRIEELRFADGSVFQPPPAPPATRPAWTVGDPHLQTLDGVGYDFHAVGEYVLLRGKEGGALDGLFEVQSRMAKVEGVAGVSVNEAVAVRLGTQIVMIDAADANPVWIDGTNTTVADGAVLSVGSHLLTRTGNDYTIFYAGANDTLENGDAQVMISVRSGRLDIAIAASDEMSSSVEGLLGDGDGNAANDIARADGTVLDRPLAYEDLYGGYRDDWRVTTDVQSLFTYDQGESLAGFYDADAPGQTVSVDDFDDAAVTDAQTLVESAGVTPGTLAYDNALLDFLLTNDAEFIESSADP